MSLNGSQAACDTRRIDCVHITSLFTCAYISVNRFRFPLKTHLPNVSRQVGVNLSRANVKYMSFDCGDASGATIKRALSKQALKRRALSRNGWGFPSARQSPAPADAERGQGEVGSEHLFAIPYVCFSMWADCFCLAFSSRMGLSGALCVQRLGLGAIGAWERTR